MGYTYITYLCVCITVLRDYHGKEIGADTYTGTKIKTRQADVNTLPNINAGT